MGGEPRAACPACGSGTMQCDECEAVLIRVGYRPGVQPSIGMEGSFDIGDVYGNRWTLFRYRNEVAIEARSVHVWLRPEEARKLASELEKIAAEAESWKGDGQ